MNLAPEERSETKQFMYKEVLYKDSIADQDRKEHPEQRVLGQCPGHCQTH